MPEIISFAQALERTAGAQKRHLLLGNGFSRAWRDNVFSYGALFDQANFAGLSLDARAAFDALHTRDFEVVMLALRQAGALSGIYLAEHPEVAQRFQRDADGLKELLAQTIAASHPDRPNSVLDLQYAACRSFLSNFRNIYTVNYDLLLYWTLMHEEIEPMIEFDDGFRKPDDEAADYVTWDVQKTDSQTLFYLHGGLHIFDAGAKLQKFTWCNTGVALIDQIRDALADDRFPLFVAEGSADSKLDRIQHSGFLNRAYRSFSSIGGVLFIFGLSFGDTDEHILKLLDTSKVSHLLVGLHGDPDSAGNQRIVRRAELMQARRPRRRPLTAEFFDSASAGVWGP
jgi:hypothetical protein